jgi:hypothetical protein
MQVFPRLPLTKPQQATPFKIIVHTATKLVLHYAVLPLPTRFLLPPNHALSPQSPLRSLLLTHLN